MNHFDPAALAAFFIPFKPVARCWIAFSGGLDSTVLLTAAAAVRDQLPGALSAIHLDHGLHPHSASWVAHCQTRCAELAVPLIIRRLHVPARSGDSLEAVARAARYRACAEVLEPHDLLLTAHHQDDQAETLLLALVRGGGVQGLAAMPPVLALGAGQLVRPLLAVQRTALLAYAQAQRLTWIDDPSNQVTAFDRNYLRQQVLPLLRDRWPAVVSTLARSASHCGEAAQLVEHLAAQSLTTLGGTRRGTLDIGELLRLARPLQYAVLRLWLKRGDFQAPTAHHLERIRNEVLLARADANPLVTWAGCEMRRYRQDLFALAPLPPAPASTAAPLRWPVSTVPATLKLPPGLGWLDWLPNDTATPRLLQVRFGVTGLRCQRGAGQTGALKRLYQAHGIPLWWRPYVPLVFSGERLLALAGICDCQTPDGSGGEVRWRGHGFDLMPRRSTV